MSENIKHGRHLNWKREPEDERDFKSIRRLSAPKTLPSSFELDRKIPIYDQGNIGSCFRGDTEIRLLNGTVRTLISLTQETEPFWVYSCDSNGSLVPGKATATLTGRNKEVIRVTLDNNEEIVCTPDHEFMLKDGSYKKAIELSKEDSLMPNNLNYDRTYERYFDNSKNKWVFTHTRINEFYNSEYRIEVNDRIKEKNDKYLVTHHRNFNKFDNTPENLEWMGELEHSSYHMNQICGTPEHAELCRRNALWLHANRPEWCDPSKGGKQAWENAQKDPVRMKQVLECLDKGRTPEVRKRAIENSRIAIQNRTSERKEELARQQSENYKNSSKMQETCRQSGKKLGGQPSNEFQCAKLGSEVILKLNELTENNWNLIRDSYVMQKTHTRIRNGKIQSYQYNYNRTPKFKTAIKVFGSFETLLERSQNYNHKVVKIEPFGVDDVYCLQVEKYHNFALSAGVFVHNCTIVSWDDSKQCFGIQNSWGTDWGKDGYFWMPYSFVTNTKECDDFWCIEEIKIENVVDPNPPNPSQIDWVVVSNVLFKTAKELYAVNKPTILRLGEALGLSVDNKKNFSYNYNLVKTKLGL